MTSANCLPLLLKLDASPVHDGEGLQRHGRLDEEDGGELAAYREALKEQHADELKALRLEGADEGLLARRQEELARKAEEALEARRRRLMAAHFSAAELAGATHLYLELTFEQTRTLLGRDGTVKEDFRPTALPINPHATPSERLTPTESDLDYRLRVSLDPQGRDVDPAAFTNLGCRHPDQWPVGYGETVTFAGEAAEAMHGIALKKAASPPVETMLKREGDNRWLRTDDGAGLMGLDKDKIEGALLLHADGEELRAHFRNLLGSSKGDRDVLLVLEDGFSADFGTVFRTDDLRSRLRKALEPEDVMPLLTSEDPVARDEGLRLIGSIPSGDSIVGDV